MVHGFCLSVQLAIQKAAQVIRDRGGRAGFAFPDYADVPARRPQRSFHPAVSFAICRQFSIPVVRPGLWHGRTLAADMRMPETAMHEERLPAAWENNVGSAWHGAGLQAESIAKCVRDASYCHLRFGIALPYAGHQLAPTLVREDGTDGRI